MLDFPTHTRVKGKAMTKKEAYYFGNLCTELEVFAFPRVGSHYFIYCLNGLFDLVALKNDHFHNVEAIARQNEINESVLYQLDLREEGVPFQPLVVDPAATGTHGLPRIGDKPAIILLRDPMATLFSFYRVSRARWGANEGIWPWLGKEHAHFVAFYTRAFELLEQHPGRALLVRYEDLIADSSALERVARFIGHRPKLRPDFVHHIMRFENFAVRGERTFYRSGRNDAWLDNPEFCEAMLKLPADPVERFGYPSVAAYQARCEERLGELQLKVEERRSTISA